MVQAVSDNGCKSSLALENELVKIVSCYEADRVGKVKEILLIEFCLAAVAVFVCCLSRLPLFKANWFTEFGVPVLVIGSAIWGGLYILSKADSEFKNNLKERCMPHIVEIFGAMNWAVGKAVISNAKCRSSELFLQFEKRKDDDSFKGRYKGVSYAISETRLRDIYRHKGRDYDSYVFDGVLINFSSNKNIEATTIVTTKGDRYIKNKNPFFV